MPAGTNVRKDEIIVSYSKPASHPDHFQRIVEVLDQGRQRVPTFLTNQL